MNIKTTNSSPIIAQIIFAFATLAFIIVVFAAAVFFAFGTIERNIRILALNTVPILDRVGEIQENTSLIQISVLRHMMTADRGKKQSEEQAIQRASEANAKLLEIRKGLFLSPQEQAMYDVALSCRAAYNRSWPRLLELSRDGRLREASDFNEETLRPAYDRYQKVLNEISAYLKKESKHRASRMDDFMAAVHGICNALSIAGLCIAAGMGLIIVRVTGKLRQSNRILEHEVSLRKKAEQHQSALILELKDALDNVRQLSGLLPICASCKKIRDDRGYWQRIETYISEHSDAHFTHGICPECSEKFNPKAGRKTP